MSRAVTPVIRQVRPILSSDKEESRKRVISLYKALYRFCVNITHIYPGTTVTSKNARKKLRELFEKNRHVTDLRAIDILVHHGQNELHDLVNHYKPPGHLMYYFQDTARQRPTTFLEKFFDGSER